MEIRRNYRDCPGHPIQSEKTEAQRSNFPKATQQGGMGLELEAWLPDYIHCSFNP